MCILSWYGCVLQPEKITNTGGKNEFGLYIAIDLKSFYASVECIERKCNPMMTNLDIADMSRTEKTVGLAVSPSGKSFGIPGRARKDKNGYQTPDKEGMI